MKKTICSLLIVMLLTAMLVPAVFAAGTSVTVGNAAATPGDEITLDVTIAGNTGFGAATFDIVYDSDVLTLTGIGVNGTLFGKGLGYQNVAGNRVNCISPFDITGDGVLFTLTFTVSENAESGNYDVTVLANNFTDASRNPITTTIVAGAVDVHSCEGTLVPANASTCTVPGNIAYYVCDCGKLYADADCTTEITLADTVVPTIDHDWKWVVDTDATCGAAGIKHEECACGAKKSEGTDIPATGNHTWNWVVDKEETCGANGVMHKECACGAKTAEGTEIPATGNHTWNWVIDKEATCGAAGSKHQECVCGSKKDEGTVIPATGNHVWNWVTDKEATCGAAGSKHEECACGAKNNEGTEIPATGNHTWIWVTDKEATCGVAGSKHQECVCGEKTAEGTEIPATGNHNWNWVIDKEPTKDEAGIKHQECECGAKQNEGTAIPNTGDNTFHFAAAAIASFVALVALAGAYLASKKQESK